MPRDPSTADPETSEELDSSESRIIVLSGPSGSGKSTVVDELICQSSVPLMKMVSATTRPKRVGEIDGEDYYFLSSEEFETRRNNQEFVECEEVYANGFWYGTLKSELHRAKKLKTWAFLEIDVRGALRVMEQYPQATTVFLTTPSEEVFEQRLRDRGTETEDVIQRRLRRAREELKSADRYHHRVCNDELQRAVAEIVDILVSREAELNA